MPHEIERLIRAAGRGVWFIEPRRAEELVAALALRAQMGPRAFDDEAREARPRAAADSYAGGGQKVVRVLRLHGAILPRGNLMAEMCGSGAVSLDRFGREFRAAADDASVAAIVLDVDSPGGQVDLVPETAALIRGARKAERPIVAVANTLACSAAYWIASACDEVVVTPSGQVGSIGVYMLHQDVGEQMKMLGIAPTFVYEGPRKVEGHPFGPLAPEAKAALQAEVRAVYEAFTGDVAKARGVPASVVRADPEAAERHMGGGRSYPAAEAVRLGMADRVATLDETIARLLKGARGGQARKSSAMARRRLALA